MKLEIKNINEDGLFYGYASTFNEIDLKGDIILPNAFKAAIRDFSDIDMLFQHDFGIPLGKWIEIEENNVGLHVTGKIFKNLYMGEEIYNMIREKKICGLSIGFKPIMYETDGNVRRLTKIDLREISIVRFPANRSALINKVES
ncbi:HK97 family phage prohead protease [Candidatus Cytomitobacter indipagum]|uniref:HK97 family phage prohead protease n=1 Tax=Candidatus Cytomitobacter indipagum TaxID=2601575 RepID=A0A5C0UFL3_9PROT|nr:HK97 family phage prohead protease [Candidatus Cytomitobacter indipagum]QEK38052.1 HK97 family phage prohead protease [Candidatus Cytomitobacter indipagum]